ncbi:hypothetical protein PDIDSM_1673 [Penicillium digitatum]|nr:hypothetical protein PDIDSM_1673 [Penicillium digitatum]
MESPESYGSRVPRDLNTCSGTAQWYVCTAGNFRGCCSSNPCTSGICPDDDEDDTLSLTTAGVIGLLPNLSPRTTTVSSTSTLSVSTDPTSTAITASLAASITSETSAGSETPTASETFTSRVTLTASKVSFNTDTTMAIEPTGATALSSILAASASPSSTSFSNPKAASSNLGAIIGGVVGGIAVLILCIALLFCCCRRKREYGKRGKGLTFVTWYPSRFTRKDRVTSSEMKAPLSPSDYETHMSPFTTDSTQASIMLTPDLALGPSSTSLIPYSPHKTPPVPPTQPHSTELFASVPPRRGFTPELPDTGFHRLRAELASHSQSELINVPIEQRQRQQNHSQSINSLRAWESPALAPIASSHAGSARNGSSHSHSNSNGGSPGRNQTGRLITAEGVVLGANLDRYSNSMETGESQAQNERGRTAERGRTDHVMSFMQYAGRPEDRGLGNGLGIAISDYTSSPQARRRSASGSRPKPVERSLEDDIAAAESNVDVPPAYEVKEGAPGPDLKSPSGRMCMSPRSGT